MVTNLISMDSIARLTHPSGHHHIKMRNHISSEKTGLEYLSDSLSYPLLINILGSACFHLEFSLSTSSNLSERMSRQAMPLYLAWHVFSTLSPILWPKLNLFHTKVSQCLLPATLNRAWERRHKQGAMLMTFRPMVQLLVSLVKHFLKDQHNIYPSKGH